MFEIVKTDTGYAAPTTLVSFTATGTNGATPQGSLLADTNGALFGTTIEGGAHNAGTVFEITVPPTITGTVANQSGFLLPIHLFGSVVVGNVDFGQKETVTVTSTSTVPFGLNGILTDPHASTDGSHNANGVYTVTGSEAAVTSVLRGLLFHPGLGTTDFTIKVTDPLGQMAIDHTTSVIGVSLNGFLNGFEFGVGLGHIA